MFHHHTTVDTYKKGRNINQIQIIIIYVLTVLNVLLF